MIIAQSTVAASGHTSRVVVFYDGGCGMCRAEIRHYMRLDRTGQVRWVDINRDQTLLGALGIPHERAMQRLHVLDADGVIQHGVRGFVALWSALPYYRHLARLVLATRSAAWLEWIYQRFAIWRYARRTTSTACPVGAPSATGVNERAE